MTRPVRVRSLAVDDIDTSIDYYLREAGDDAAGRFIDSVERALSRISRNPSVGSLRFAFELQIPDLRCIPLARFPHLVFYMEAADHIDVWRVLHTRRDIPTTLLDA